MSQFLFNSKVNEKVSKFVSSWPTMYPYMFFDTQMTAWKSCETYCFLCQFMFMLKDFILYLSAFWSSSFPYNGSFNCEVYGGSIFKDSFIYIPKGGPSSASMGRKSQKNSSNRLFFYTCILEWIYNFLT